MSDTNTRKIIIHCLKEISKLPIYTKRWLSDTAITTALLSYANNELLPTHIKEKMSFILLNKCLNKCKFPSLFDLCTPNMYGIFKRVYRKKSLNRYVHCYYLCENKSCIPVFDTLWYDHVVFDVNKILSSQRHTRSMRRTLQTAGVIERRDEECTTTNIEERTDDSQRDDEIEKALKSQTKWDSPEAMHLFLPAFPTSSLNDDNTNQQILIKQQLRKALKRLVQGWQHCNGWRGVVDGDEDRKDKVTEKMIFKIRVKCKFLSVALNQIIQSYDSSTLKTILNNACIYIYRYEYMQELEYEESDNIRQRSFASLQKWLRSYIRNGYYIPNPIKDVHRKARIPPMLSDNPELYNGLQSFCVDNHHHLSTELVQDYILNKGLPALVISINQSFPITGQVTVESLMKQYSLKMISISTVNRWLNDMGYKYCDRKKCYYTDSHERPDVIQHRKEFVTTYLDVIELRCHRYIQIPIDFYNEFIQQNKIQSNVKGHKYTDTNGYEMIEHHVDDHPFFQSLQSDLVFGGSLSVRRPTHQKPLIIFGQDECIFKQYTFTKKTWCLPDGRFPLIPKDEGSGVMVSAFVSRDFGFGMKFTIDQLSAINNKRKDECYMDSQSAILKRGKAEKEPLSDSPFVRYLLYGANLEGYWSYEDMILQLEDIVDCLKTIYPQFDYYFLFDHSNGHDRKRPDGLCVNKVSKYYGGSQPIMRESVVIESDIGPYEGPGILRAGDVHVKVFKEEDSGPINLTNRMREERRYDKVVGKKEVQLSKDELMHNLVQVGINKPLGSRQKLQLLCQQNNLPIKKQVDKVIEGWVGKPKGSLQLLYERGWIDIDKINQYTVNGRVDEYGSIIPGTSLTEMMLLQNDFANEESLLELFARMMGVESGKSPIAHPEVAGEGVEFDWGAGKMYYRSQPIKDKRTKDLFVALVKRSLSEIVLSKERVRSFSKHAREYMIGYRALAQQMEEQDRIIIEDTKVEKVEMSHALMEKCVKLFRKRRSHRNAMDFDSEFIKGVLLKMEQASE
jgi:hypothetical protein